MKTSVRFCPRVSWCLGLFFLLVSCALLATEASAEESPTGAPSQSDEPEATESPPGSSLERCDSASKTLARLFVDNKGPRELLKRERRIATASTEDLHRVARQWLSVDSTLFVVSGPRTTIVSNIKNAHVGQMIFLRQ